MKLGGHNAASTERLKPTWIALFFNDSRLVVFCCLSSLLFHPCCASTRKNFGGDFVNVYIQPMGLEKFAFSFVRFTLVLFCFDLHAI